MKVKEVMKKDIIRVPLGTSLEDVAKLLFKHQISGLLVVDENDKLVGIVSEKDVYKKLYPDYKDYYDNPEINLDFEEMENRAHDVRHLKVEDFMIKNVETVSVDDPLMKAGAVILTKKINRLPVMDGDKLVGIVSRRDIYQKVLQAELGFKI